MAGRRATALANISGAYLFLGRLPQAAEHLNQALRIDRQTGRLGGQASRLNNLGVVHWQMGQLEQSAAYYSEALALHPLIGVSPTETAMALANLGETYHALGRIGPALDHLNRALDMHRALGDEGEADTLRALACLHRDAGRYAEALKCAEAAHAMAAEAGDDPRQEAHTLVALGTIRHCLGEHPAAIELHRHALKIAIATGNRYPQTEALIGLATAHLARDEPDQATDHINHALAIARNLGYRMLEGQALTVLVDILRHRHRPVEAADHARQAITIHRETGYRIGEEQARRALGHIANFGRYTVSGPPADHRQRDPLA